MEDLQRFGFISRHRPTQGQIDMARGREIELVWLGDMDAWARFTDPGNDEVRVALESDPETGPFHGFVVVHPALAIRLLAAEFQVGVFENATRPAEGAAPAFVAKALHVYRLERTNNSLTFEEDGGNIGCFMFP